jgi:cyclic pyranopterin phosphate synthase
VGFISAMSQHFCRSCNRLRLTASGQLRACLMSGRQTDIKEVLRTGGSDEDLARCFRAAVRQKPIDHCLSADSRKRIEARMSSIGG